jgi:hypothetical protein
MQNSDSTNPPITTRQVVGLVVLLAFCVGLAAGIIHFAKGWEAEKREAILRNPGYATGTITRVRTYKKKRISVQYTVGGKQYFLRTRVSRAFLRTHDQGDTTAVIYSKADPASAMLRAKLRPSSR